jgi:hypothetical protein
MESLMKPVALTQDVSKVLDEIRAGAENALYGAGPDVSEELFAKQVVSLIEGAGLPVLQTMHYRWFLRELARLWRTRTGRDLAFHLELCIRKWVGLGLEPRTLQFLVCESYERLKGKELTTKRPEPQYPGTPEPVTSTTKTPSHQEEQSPSPSLAPSPSPLAPNPDFSRPGIMAGPRPPARGPEDSTTKTQRHKGPGPDSSADAGSDHSIPRSLDPSIPSELS